MEPPNVYPSSLSQRQRDELEREMVRYFTNGMSRSDSDTGLTVLGGIFLIILVLLLVPVGTLGVTAISTAHAVGLAGILNLRW